MAWEFPGGKIEPGETGEQALVRECREELGVTVEPTSVHSVVKHEYPDLTVKLTLFNAGVIDGELTPIEHTELKFISAFETGEYEFCPADEEILRLIEADAKRALRAERTSPVIRKLLDMRDEAYAEFSTKLVPGMDAERFIGVRIPRLRLFAKELVKSGESYDFLSLLPHWYHDENMLHALILNEEKDLAKLTREIASFLPFVDNWAVCDTLKPKLFKKRHAELWELIPSYLASEHTYTVRFGLGMLMAHFLDDDFTPEVLKLAFDAACKSPGSEYYIDMMAAWFFATALAKQYEATLPYIARLPQPVRGMTIRKACESFRVTEEQKQIIRQLK